ncbi:MAG TPA: nicotinate-nucleotide adenylyltransferase [Chitinispirillaceae bacterium]|nr:nicotinate-nucleotide adenylyltransferase [Chitinispirillaceae bacterium]
MNRPIGILGGVFDPVHNGHLAIATLAKEYFNLQTVLFIPSGNPPHKNSVTATAVHRLEMLKIALKETPWAQIWDNEVRKNGYSYSFDTMCELKAIYKKPLFFIVGSDNLNEIPLWHRYKDFLSMITLCVTERPGFNNDQIPDELKEAEIKWFPSPEWGLSSSMIRSMLCKGYSCKYLIPDDVLGYIKENRLYDPEEQMSIV